MLAPRQASLQRIISRTRRRKLSVRKVHYHLRLAWLLLFNLRFGHFLKTEKDIPSRNPMVYHIFITTVQVMHVLSQSVCAAVVEPWLSGKQAGELTGARSLVALATSASPRALHAARRWTCFSCSRESAYVPFNRWWRCRWGLAAAHCLARSRSAAHATPTVLWRWKRHSLI